MDNAYAVIMSGGRGQRFWPLSTMKRPKQMLSLVGDKPMIAVSVERLKGLIPPERILVVTSVDLVDATYEAAPDLLPGNVIGEPYGRDTAAAVALAYSLVKARHPNAVFAILTADHVIKDVDIFQATVREGMTMAMNQDVLITIGINPGFPSTGFGYIEFGEPVKGGDRIGFYRARKFVEKPDRATAEGYLKAGCYCWNSGMFIWSVASIRDAFRKYRPELYEMAERMSPFAGTCDFDGALKEEYDKLEKISVDYAIMERADNIVMAKGMFRWYDVGSWPALADHFDADSSGNVAVGDCQSLDSGGNVVVSPDRLTALIGVKDLVVVQAEGATLVCAKGSAQDVKKMVDQLERAGTYGHVL